MISGETLHNPFSSLLPHLQQPTNKPYRHTFHHVRTTQPFPSSRCFDLLRFRRNPSFKFIRVKSSNNAEMGTTSGFLGSDESDLPVELSYTRTLPPSLTLEHGLIKIKEEVEKLKLNPPPCSSGVVRIQVAVPPNPKSWNWLCSQSESLEVFPQFYLSKTDSDKPISCSHLFDEVLGISGIGAAVYFTSSSSALKKWNSINRYLSVDSPLIRAYGFNVLNIDVEASYKKHVADAFYFVIPQIELDEYGSVSILAATLVWDDTSCYYLGNALHSLELFLYQAIRHLYVEEAFQNKMTSFAHNKIDQGYISVHSPLGACTYANYTQLDGDFVSSQFLFRLSPTIAFANNMLEHPIVVSSSLQHSANINALWASLIIEELCRLGLTYFCIAPGSRSSPLAVAASTHPRTTCMSCYDERSLSFHAVGYARGSIRPAVVITSSGTAVSNLLPAVVEASHDFVPLLLLTADRPPELQEAGANQAINQVNHFGSFVRYFVNLPPPTDDISARMVLTTIDSAVNWATNVPYGPVHINCPFREPLEGTAEKWKFSCLNGLDTWISREEPYTKYIRVSHSHACNNIPGQIAEVLQLIQCAQRGLLLIGAIHSENEVWAALLLAKHLSWPIVADILSGLRLRKVLTSYPEINETLLFLDHLDHSLLSHSVRNWVNPDAIIQIGSKITSKRVCQMIEICDPCSYIMVDKHPYRHDPSHIVTHRVQSSITAFADSVLRIPIPRTRTKWRNFLQALNAMVAREISFQIRSEGSLTEPHVAQVISEAISSDAALFIGNSMVIRDIDMYGCGWVKPVTDKASIWSSWEVPCIGISACGNRGASGIDGLLSTAVGFAVGCNKRVICMIGDISFLHDTNGLAILNKRISRKPMTVVVINNHGGAIFSLLPIADVTQQSVLDQYFYTSHNMSVRKLCEAHGLKYLQVRTKLELQHALLISEQAQADLIIEVESSIEDNACFHRTLRRYACQAADHALSIISKISIPDRNCSNLYFCKIHKMEYSLYRIRLSAPPTSSPISDDPSRFYREGFIVTLHLEDGSVGFGEVAPLEIHRESLMDVEEQIRLLIHIIRGAKISYYLPALRGSFSFWIWRSLGLPPHSLFPSVRCGLEMAILNAYAAKTGSSLSALLLDCYGPTLETQVLGQRETMRRSPSIQICALLDSNGTPEEVAHVSAKLVEEGFTTIKLKVARRADPYEDGAVIRKVRAKVGQQIKLRVDANRRWAFNEAIQFGSCIKYCDLQYIEEPVNSEDDILEFCDVTGLPVALDETIDNMRGDPLSWLAKFIHPRIVAFVIKPSVVGGFENAALIAKWAQQRNKMAVVSAAFESTLGLSTYVQFSHYLQQQNVEICRLENKELPEPVAHGLGTYRWLKEDVATEPLEIFGRPYNDVVEASVEDAAHGLANFKMNTKVIQRSYSGEHVRKYHVKVEHDDYSCSFKVQETGVKSNNNDVVVFLHGFLGTSDDWVPIMKAISESTQCISIDLPGHGESKIERHGNDEPKQQSSDSSMSIDVVSNMLSKVIRNITTNRVVIVGYSMGARIALYMSLRCCDQIDGAVVISGSPGLKDVEARRSRMAHDEARARFLAVQGLEVFLKTWYNGELWESLRDSPYFKQMILSRMLHDDIHALARTLSDLSIGRQPSLWEELKQCKTSLLFVVGEKDRKFKKIAEEMCNELGSMKRYNDHHSEGRDKMVEIPDCGHAVHLENPLSLISAVRQFLTKRK